MDQKRTVFMISDGTGITAESLGSSLLTQFESFEFEKIPVPYVDTSDKAEALVARINHCFAEQGTKPLVFMTMVNRELSERIKQSNACVFDFFGSFLLPLEQELHTKSAYLVGRTHGVADDKSYDQRIEAVNYALEHDDGVKYRGYEKAEIILAGVSRSGKTPTCLYMALQFGILAANYPFTDEELSDLRLPEVLRPYKHKLFGLTIEKERLQQIRTERHPNSHYASMEQCRLEVAKVEAMYHQEKIPFLNSTRYSIEEIATRIMAAAGLKRKF